VSSGLLGGGPTTGKNLNGLQRLAAAECNLRPQGGHVVEPYDSILWKAHPKIIGKRRCANCVSCQNQRQRRSILRFPSFRKAERRRSSLTGLHSIAEKRLPHGGRGFETRGSLMYFGTLGSGNCLQSELPRLI